MKLTGLAVFAGPLFALALAAAPGLAQAPPDSATTDEEPHATPADSAEARRLVRELGAVLGDRSEWPFDTATTDSAPTPGPTALSSEEIDALVVWASGPNIGLLSATVATMVHASQRQRLAAVLLHCQAHPEVVEALRAQRDPILAVLGARHLVSDLEAAILGNPDVAPLLLWFRVEDSLEGGAQVRERSGWPIQLAWLSAYAALPRDPAMVGDADAGTLVAIDRRLMARPLAERLDFGTRFIASYAVLRDRELRQSPLRFDRPSPRLQRFMHELTAAAERAAAADSTAR